MLCFLPAAAHVGSAAAQGDSELRYVYPEAAAPSDPLRRVRAQLQLVVAVRTVPSKTCGARARILAYYATPEYGDMSVVFGKRDSADTVFIHTACTQYTCVVCVLRYYLRYYILMQIYVL